MDPAKLGALLAKHGFYFYNENGQPDTVRRSTRRSLRKSTPTDLTLDYHCKPV